ncbi:hypothetical protein Scep_005794 [Stephania cephalantha]|uniref:Protein SCAR n=1 Tax=Stephania cephalantha TaxID=152367 RepID=A0AAP0PXU5_9MAGN
MPLTRYQIRNEYSLADPELYRAADKDDPEALLEGVAMAGLVGVLRQLGDLAEVWFDLELEFCYFVGSLLKFASFEFIAMDPGSYAGPSGPLGSPRLCGFAVLIHLGFTLNVRFAAEIFHDLHEEVMVTATRGHGLTIRVQQLEVEFPSVEKAILSQTSHTTFIKNAGSEWHPNLEMNQNLVTRGDLPRFIMDSYEECRGPPRLFLLDKFDMAGAGACLKRYSDPSFFKAEFNMSKSTKSEDRKEKRTRKTKLPLTAFILYSKQKKVLRARNGENAEIQTSHSKLHDLFLEESGQTEDKNVHKHHVKLKRRLSNRSLVDSTTRKSYMERILDGNLPNGTAVSGNVSHSLQAKKDHSSGELVPEIHEIYTKSPANKLAQEDWGEVPSPTKERNVQERSLDKLDDEFIKEGILEELPKSTHDIELEDTLSTICDAEDQKELVVNGERKIEVSADGYKSDDVTSEIENYMDALNTMESEIETDTESRPRNGHGFMIEKKWMNSSINEEHREIQVQFSDNHSIGSSLASDDGTHSLIKERLSSSHSYSNVLPDSLLPDGDAEANVCSSTEKFPAETVDLPVEKNSDHLFVSGSGISMHAVPNGTWNEVPEISSYASEYEEKTANSDVPESTSAPSNVSEACTGDVQLVGPYSSPISSDIHQSVSEASLSNVAERHENRSADVLDLLSLEGDDMLSVRSHEERALEMLKCGKPDASYDAAAQLSSSLDLADEKVDANYDTSVEFLHGCHAEDGSVENLAEDKHDLPDSVAHSVDYCLTDQESDACSVGRSVPEHIQDYPIQSDCNDTRSSSVAEISNGLQNGKPLECLAAVLGSPEEKQFIEMADEVPHLQLDLAEVGTDNAEIESLDEKPADNVLDSVIQDGSALDQVHLKYEDAARNNDLSLDFSNRSDVSYSTDTELAAENPSELCNLATGAILAVEDKDTLLNHVLTDFSSAKYKQIEENDFSQLNPTERIAENTEAEDQSAVFSSEENLVLSYQESDLLPGSPIINNMHDELLAEERDMHSQSGDGSQLLSSALDGKQETKLEQSLSVGTENCVSLSTHLLPEPAVLGMSSDQHVGSHQVGGSFESSYKGQEQKEFPDLSDGFSSAPLKSFLLDPISVRSDVLPHRPVFGLSPANHDDQEASVLDAPPLPPLPPLQWRMGKFQQNSLLSRGLMPQQSSNPFSAAPTVTADAIAQHGYPTSGGEHLHYSNPFLPSIIAPHNEKTQNVPQESQTETMLPGMNLVSSLVQDLEREKNQHNYQVLEPTAAQHQNSFLAQENVRAHHVSSDVGDEMLQASSSNVRNSSLVSEIELERATSPRSPMWQEEEKMGQGYEISGGVMVHHTNSSAPATLGNEYSRYVSNGSEGEYAFQSDISADSSALETGKPNGSLKAWLARPRDPLIEAVASHNKSNLRKVTERVRPEISPKVEERDSLLEQIRTKSFNLRPATATRPSIHGPKTNLKVVAILEKANAIRQALAGSDDEDDDEDNWSDS